MRMPSPFATFSYDFASNSIAPLIFYSSNWIELRMATSGLTNLIHITQLSHRTTVNEGGCRNNTKCDYPILWSFSNLRRLCSFPFFRSFWKNPGNVREGGKTPPPFNVFDNSGGNFAILKFLQKNKRCLVFAHTWEFVRTRGLDSDWPFVFFRSGGWPSHANLEKQWLVRPGIWVTLPVHYCSACPVDELVFPQLISRGWPSKGCTRRTSFLPPEILCKRTLDPALGSLGAHLGWLESALWARRGPEASPYQAGLHVGRHFRFRNWTVRKA